MDILCVLFWRWNFINNNNDIFIKARIDSKLSEVLKIILNKMNMTQQEFFDKKIKEFIIENINLVVSVDDNKSDKKWNQIE